MRGAENAARESYSVYDERDAELCNDAARDFIKLIF